MDTAKPLTIEVVWDVEEDKPKQFLLGERTVPVEEVLDRWIGSDHEYIKVRGDGKSVYILRRDDRTGSWELTLYNSGDPDPRTRLSST